MANEIPVDYNGKRIGMVGGSVDLAPVVRCKDCEYFVYLEDIMTPDGILLVGRCELTAHRHPEDWYCADGERR